MLNINFCSGRPIVHIKQGRLSGKRRKTKNGNDFITLNIYFILLKLIRYILSLNIYLSHNFICAQPFFYKNKVISGIIPRPFSYSLSLQK